MNGHTLLTYSTIYDTILVQDDLKGETLPPHPVQTKGPSF
jgi:hypothetical protein